jgi:subtilase family serine protease
MLFLIYVLLCINIALGYKFQIMEKMISRASLTKLGPAEKHIIHEVTVAVKQKNLDRVKVLVEERSTPGSPLYQQWLPLAEVRSLTRNNEALREVVSWLNDVNATISWTSSFGEYVRAHATIETWERALDTKFFLFQDSQLDSSEPRHFYRSEEYSLPTHLIDHVHAVFGASHAPSPITHPSVRSLLVAKNKNLRVEDEDTVTPQLLSEYYSIPIDSGVSI